MSLHDYDDDDEATYETLLQAHADSRAEELHTAMPGRIESYDAARQVADITPMIRRALPARDGSVVRRQFPTIRAVPVMHPRWGDWFVRAPLAAGDFVLLVFLERDPSRFLDTGELSDPPDTRQHHLAHAVAIPGFYPHPRAIEDEITDSLVIGKDGGHRISIDATGVHIGADLATQKIPLGDRLISWLDTHTHSTAMGPSGVPIALASAASPSLLSAKHEVEP